MTDGDLMQRVAALERELAEARRRTTASDALLRRVSHDLRTPLNNVFGALEIAEVQADQPEAVRRWVAVGRAAGVRLRLMLDDLIAYARATVDQGGDVVRERVDVAAVVSAAVAEVHELAVARDRVIDRVVHPADVDVLTDPGRLRHVLVDLLVNALARSGAGRVTVGVEASGRTVEFTVADESAGLTDAEQAALASTFRPDDPEPAVGPDLAITVARTLVAELGGELRFDEGGAAGRAGCTARFALPVR